MFKVTERAAHFYKREMGLQNGDALRLYVRYGGQGRYGFSLGIEKAERKSKLIDKAEVEGITFWASHEDRWFLDEIILDADENLNDVVLMYVS
ncbi:MAG: HesB/YadR/YfhF family protein [Tuberibacillus sp.]